MNPRSKVSRGGSRGAGTFETIIPRIVPYLGMELRGSMVLHVGSASHLPLTQVSEVVGADVAASANIPIVGTGVPAGATPIEQVTIYTCHVIPPTP